MPIVISTTPSPICFPVLRTGPHKCLFPSPSNILLQTSPQPLGSFATHINIATMVPSTFGNLNLMCAAILQGQIKSLGLNTKTPLAPHPPKAVGQDLSFSHSHSPHIGKLRSTQLYNSTHLFELDNVVDIKKVKNKEQWTRNLGWRESPMIAKVMLSKYNIILMWNRLENLPKDDYLFIYIQIINNSTYQKKKLLIIVFY